jgi:hypothetical protein
MSRKPTKRVRTNRRMADKRYADDVISYIGRMQRVGDGRG